MKRPYTPPSIRPTSPELIALLQERDEAEAKAQTLADIIVDDALARHGDRIRKAHTERDAAVVRAEALEERCELLEDIVLERTDV